MQVYTNSKRQSLKIILAFFAILYIAYLPASTFLFFIKNDAFNGYFPPKFFMSESIHAGHLPLWNPYINFGLPQYGDMSSGCWSPITWLIASTVGYNAYTFTIEILTYIFIGGISVYKLTGYFNLQKNVRFISAIAYMCCGYNVGHLQHFNWLSGAAFLPLCLWSYLKLYDNITLKNILQSALIFYLFIASAHPGLIIGGFYFFGATAIFLLLKNKKQFPFYKDLKHFAITNSFLIIALLLISSGLIIGYTDIIPHFSRGSKVLLEAALKNPTSFHSWISFVLPLSTTKNDSLFSTDISMRNIYFSLTLFLFFLTAIFQKKNAWQRFLLITGIGFLFLSSGGIFKTFSYKFIPLISFVRLDGEFVIFSLLCFILLAAIQLDKFISEKKDFKDVIKWIYFFIEFIVIAIIVFGLYKVISSKESFFYSTGNSTQINFSQKLKNIVDAITFYDALWLQGFVQLFLLWGIKFCLREKRWNLLVKIVVADMVLATLFNLPFTGVGKASVAQVQNVLNNSPKGIPIPNLQPVNKNDTISIGQKGLVGDWSFYNKQIGVKKETPYPIKLNNTEKYFDVIKTTSSLDLNSNDFLFSTNKNRTKPGIINFSGNKIEFTFMSDDTGRIVYQQAFYPHWYYDNGTGKKEVEQYLNTFISVPVIKGNNKIEISFEPQKVKIAMLISLIVFCIILILLLSNPAFINKKIISSY